MRLFKRRLSDPTSRPPPAPTGPRSPDVGNLAGNGTPHLPPRHPGSTTPQLQKHKNSSNDLPPLPANEGREQRSLQTTPKTAKKG